MTHPAPIAATSLHAVAAHDAGKADNQVATKTPQEPTARRAQPLTRLGKARHRLAFLDCRLKTDPNPRLASLRGRLAAEIAAMEQREQDRNHRALRTSEQDRIRRALRTQQAATPPPAQPPSTDLSPASWPTPPPPTSITTRIAKISSSGIQAARSEPIAPCVEDECAQLVALARRCTAAGQRFPAIHAAAEGALKAAARIMIAIEARWPNRPPEADEPTHVD